MPIPAAPTDRSIVMALVALFRQAGRPCDRDRNSEFVPSPCAPQDLLDLLSEADALLDDVAPSLDDRRLWESVGLPTLPPEEQRPVITWLIGNYGHAREHVGHIQLTKQLRQETWLR